MSRTRTLTAMLSDVRQRTNMENSTFVTDNELTEYLNQELAELWSRLVFNSGQPHYRSSFPIAVTAGTALYALPSDFWTVQEVMGSLHGASGPILPFTATEHGILSGTAQMTPFEMVRYRIQGSNIEFRPANATFSATLFYAPCQPRLVSLSDTFDGFNGYEMAAIYGVAATVLDKEGSDPNFYLGQRERIYQHIEKMAAHRDMANPERVQDVTLAGDWVGRAFGWVG